MSFIVFLNIARGTIFKVTINNTLNTSLENYNIILNLSKINLTNYNITICYNISNCENTTIPFCYLHENWMCNTTKSDTIVLKINYTPANSKTVFYIATTTHDTATNIANVYALFEHFNASSLSQIGWECLSNNYTVAYCQLVNGTYLYIHSPDASKYRVDAQTYYPINATMYTYILFTKAITYNEVDGFLLGFSNGTYMLNYTGPQDDPINGYYGAIARYGNAELDIIKSVDATQTKITTLSFGLVNNSWYYVTFIWNKTRFDLIVKNETNQYHIYGYDSEFNYFDHIFIGGDYADYYFDYVGLLKIPNNATVSVQYVPPIQNVTIITNAQYFTNQTINVTVKLTITAYNIQNITVITYLYDPYAKYNVSKYTYTLSLVNGTKEYEFEAYLQPPLRQDIYYVCVYVLNQTFCKQIYVYNYYYNISLQLLNSLSNAIVSLNETINYISSQINYTNSLISNLNATINELYSTILSINQSTTEKLNEILDNLTTLYLKISDVATYIAQVNQTLYNKLLDIQSQIYELKSNITELINALQQNLTQQINNLQQNILSSISQLNQSIITTQNMIVSINESINQIISKLNNLYDLTMSINGTTQQILNKTITILQQLYNLQSQLTSNMSVVTEKINELAQRLGQLVKPSIIIDCPYIVYVNDTVECEIRVKVLNKDLDIPINVFIQKLDEKHNVYVTIESFKVYAFDGLAKINFSPSSVGKYKILVSTVPGYYIHQTGNYYIVETYTGRVIYSVYPKKIIIVGQVEYSINYTIIFILILVIVVAIILFENTLAR